MALCDSGDGEQSSANTDIDSDLMYLDLETARWVTTITMSPAAVESAGGANHPVCARDYEAFFCCRIVDLVFSYVVLKT